MVEPAQSMQAFLRGFVPLVATRGQAGREHENARSKNTSLGSHWFHSLLAVFDQDHLAIGFVWLSFADDGAAEEAFIIRQGHGEYGYQIAALVSCVVFADNLLSAHGGTTGDDVLVGEVGPTGTDTRVWDAQCDYATSVLV